MWEILCSAGCDAWHRQVTTSGRSSSTTPVGNWSLKNARPRSNRKSTRAAATPGPRTSATSSIASPHGNNPSSILNSAITFHRGPPRQHRVPLREENHLGLRQRENRWRPRSRQTCRRKISPTVEAALRPACLIGAPDCGSAPALLTTRDCRRRGNESCSGLNVISFSS